MKNYLFLFLCAFLLSACATVFNTRSEKINIVTSESSTVIVNNVPLKTSDNHVQTRVKRSSQNLELIVSSDSITKNVSVEPGNSFLFWSNLCFAYGLGMIIDWKNPKRFSYPSTVYIDMLSKENTYSKLDLSEMTNRNIIKITPLKLFGTTNPGVQLAYERKHSSLFSTQFMVQSLFPRSILISSGLRQKKRGFRASIEERMYIDQTAPVGNYVAFEVNYLQNQRNAIMSFSPIKTYDLYQDSLSYNDSIRIKKQTVSFNIKLGKQWVKNNFAVDFYVGFGLRYKDIRILDRINENHYESDESDYFPNINRIGNREGKYWTISMPLNVKIGYSF